MVMSSRDGTLPVGWWVRGELEGTIGEQPIPAIFLVRVQAPHEAQALLKAYRPTLKGIQVGETVKAETFDRLGISPGEAWGPL